MENFLLKCSMVDPLMASLPFYQNQFEQNHCKLSILLVRKMLLTKEIGVCQSSEDKSVLLLLNNINNMPRL